MVLTPYSPRYIVWTVNDANNNQQARPSEPSSGRKSPLSAALSHSCPDWREVWQRREARKGVRRG